MSGAVVWVPGAAGPHEELVRNLHAQIARQGDGVAVEVELADGASFSLISIAAEPGYGFVTLRPHPEDREPKEVVVPVASIAQIRIGAADPHAQLGFVVPTEESREDPPSA